MSRKPKFFALVLLAAFAAVAVVGCGGSQPAAQAPDEPRVEADPSKKAILVAAFGTSYADTRAVTLEASRDAVAEAYPDYDVEMAFTSDIIRGILSDRDGIEIPSIGEALEAFYQGGYSKVIVQPLHVMNGAEYYEDVVATAALYEDKIPELTVGRALLSGFEDYETFITAVDEIIVNAEVADDEALVLMGHGTHHPANSAYSQLSLMLAEEHDNVFVGTVEGYPAFDNVLAELKEAGYTKIVLAPLMIVAGDHANNDMAGDEEDSWKMMLKQEGFEARAYLHGLGESGIIRGMYINSTQDAIDGNPSGHVAE